ncbi:murein biosynthesis integral membrane protein MurJ [Candidatus Uhrbacteria bacterium]|nr:murein biosynthesis integral membrane protein MurJ [Candidatus Uhrbacteria bacterium]
MLFRKFHQESKTIAGAAILVGAFSLLSRMMGFVRDRILAGTFGAGDVLDVYYAAFKVPDFLFGVLVIGALSASFIPLFTKHYDREVDREAAWRLTNNALHLTFFGAVIASVLLFFWLDPLAALIAPGFPPAKRQLVANWTGIMLAAQLLLAGSMVFGSVLQARKRFFFYASAPILYNVGIIAGSLWLVPALGPVGLAWGVVLGAALHALVQLYGAAQAGYRYRFVCDPRQRETRDMFRLMGPRMLGIAMAQVNVVCLTVMASWLAAGSVTIFTFAYNVQFFPVGIVGVAYAVAAFPMLAEHAGRDHLERFVSVLSSTVRQMLFLLIPLTLLFLIFRAQLIRLVVGAGKFGWEETILASDALAFFALSLFSQSLVFLIARAHFALRDTLTPCLAGLVSLVVNVLASLVFAPRFGIAGFALAFSISSMVNLALLWVPLRVRLGSLEELSIVQSLYRMTAAGLGAGIVMQLLKPVTVYVFPLETFVAVFIQITFAGGVGMVAYAALAFFLKSPEMTDLTASLHARLFRRACPTETVPSEPSATA